MIGRIETFLRYLRRRGSRSAWLAHLLKLPPSTGPGTRPGLVMIQIDGLSQPELETALQQGEMPFLQRLIKREHYHLHTQYSGLPSTTPAVQAELFYGVKTAVPAFTFRDPESQRVMRMFEPEAAERVERQLADTGNEALLRGGSAYADNFTGGADEAHFCPAALGWGSALRSANPLVLLLLLVSHIYSLLRTGVLLLLELVLAVTDFARGLIRGQDFFQELKFVPTRVAICVLLRELAVIGAKIDISRGLPIVHINFLGYDEQAHRRGPRSKFAHWTLKGIDDAVKRLWRAADHSVWRHYDVWIYSDHGQVTSRPWHKQQGQTIEAAVAAAFENLSATGTPAPPQRPDSEQIRRVRLLGGRRFQRLFRIPGINGAAGDDLQPQIASLGPVGFIYPRRLLKADERRAVACELTGTHGVPLVIAEMQAEQLCAWTARGEFRVPEQLAELFGDDHPFLDALRQDLVRLCRHPGAGQLALFGWCKGVTPITFAFENGAHAGATPEETNAFALLPRDTPLPVRSHEYLRPAHLRRAALQHLGRTERRSTRFPVRDAVPTTGRLRIMTYNVHSCIGMDGKLSAERIARVIARANPDVVALQELDAGRVRTDGIDQAHLIAGYLEMEFHFHPAIHIEEERYGDAILTHLPMRLIKAGTLPGLAGRPRLEPRGALWVAIDLYGTEIQIINTHLGLLPSERLAQIAALLGDEWLGHPQCRGPVILCGDLNATPTSPLYRLLLRRLRDAQIENTSSRPLKTFSGRVPSARIDHIFIQPGLEVINIEVPRSELVQVASDHLPLIAELYIPASAG